MATKAQVRTAAAKLNATIDESDALLNVDAPAGFQFAATGTHALCVPLVPGDMPFLYASLLADMKYGLQPCDGGTNCWEYGCEAALEPSDA